MLSLGTPKSLLGTSIAKRSVSRLDTPLALYVHWPFCVSKCPYCDFNSHVRESVNQDAWRSALLADLAFEAGVTAGGASPRRIGSIFFGGGTPSLMPPATVAAIIDEADRRWGLTRDCEITLEANPNSVEVANFAALASAGVNRVSVGVQALDDATLAFLGRAHGANEARRAIAAAQAHFRRVSFDLITARPDQSVATWERELAEALAFGTDHLSLYQLTIEPGTRFATLYARGNLTLPDEVTAAELFTLTRAMTDTAGLPAYEVSNHAQPGSESRHNLSYWRYRDYIGVGPGAHGRRGHHATERHRKPENWLSAVLKHGHGVKTELPLSPRERAVEAMVMGLRLTEGVDLDQIADDSGLAVADIVDTAATDALARQGLLTRDDSQLAVTASGVLLLDSILKRIVVT